MFVNVVEVPPRLTDGLDHQAEVTDRALPQLWVLRHSSQTDGVWTERDFFLPEFSAGLSVSVSVSFQKSPLFLPAGQCHNVV